MGVALHTLSSFLVFLLHKRPIPLETPETGSSHRAKDGDESRLLACVSRSDAPMSDASTGPLPHQSPERGRSARMLPGQLLAAGVNGYANPGCSEAASPAERRSAKVHSILARRRRCAKLDAA